MITKFSRIDGDSNHRAKIAFGGVGKAGWNAIDSYRLYCGDFLYGTELVAFTYPSEKADDHNKEILRRTLHGFDWIYIAVDLMEEHALEDACECAELLRSDNEKTRTELFCVVIEQNTEAPVAEVLLQHYNKVFFVQHPTQMSIPVEMVRAVGNGRNMVGADYVDLFSTISPHKLIYVLQEKCANIQLLGDTARKLAGKLILRHNHNDDVTIVVQAGMDCSLDAYESVCYDLMQYVDENAKTFLFAYYNAEEHDMSAAVTVMLCAD